LENLIIQFLLPHASYFKFIHQVHEHKMQFMLTTLECCLYDEC